MYRIYKGTGTMYRLYMEEAINLIKDALNQEQLNVTLYEEILKLSQTAIERDTINKILMDEKEHVQAFRGLLIEIINKNILPSESYSEKPCSAIDGIKKCLELKIASIDTYNKIYQNLQENKHKNTVAKLINDELKHLGQLNYLLIEKCLNNIK